MNDQQPMSEEEAAAFSEAVYESAIGIQKVINGKQAGVGLAAIAAILSEVLMQTFDTSQERTHELEKLYATVFANLVLASLGCLDDDEGMKP